MKQYRKPIDYQTALLRKCYWCISRTYNRYDCEFNQGTHFDFPCSKEDYEQCQNYKEGERIKRVRGF